MSENGLLMDTQSMIDWLENLDIVNEFELNLNMIEAALEDHFSLDHI